MSSKSSNRTGPGKSELSNRQSINDTFYADRQSDVYSLLKYPGWPDIIDEHRNIDPSEFALRYTGKKDWPVKALAEQLHCYPRAEDKLGPLHRSGMIYFREALEQASGYAVSMFRAKEWVERMDRSRSRRKPDDGYRPILVADLTGGLGVDTAAWALAGAEVRYCEKNESLSAIAKHNHRILGIDERVTYYTGDSIDQLKTWQERQNLPDLVYIDPSRRSRGHRVITLDQSDPPVTAHRELLGSAADVLLLKLSPMLDLAELSRNFPGCNQVAGISVNGEVKEILAFRGIDRPEATKEAIVLEKNGTVRCRMSSADMTDSSVPDASVRAASSGSYLFEADPVFFKLNMIDDIARSFDLHRIHHETGYLSGEFPINAFPGRSYKILDILPYKPEKVKKWLKKHRIRKVHIHQRGFALTVDQLYRKLDCKMGDDAHLVATRDYRGDYVILVTQKSNHQDAAENTTSN